MRKLGRYEIGEEIGTGGMATVYRGYDSTLKREIAVKLLHKHLTSNDEAKARFEREARSVAKLHSDSIVEIYDYDSTDEDEIFIVMELVEGSTLRDFLDSRDGAPLMAEAAGLIIRQILLALEQAHSKEIVHRDVKPENILIDKKGNVKLSDFGIAYLAGIGQMTTTGQILGSPTYMSPEHIENPTIDARADVFSVGTVMYEMVTGTPPFIGNNPHQIIKRIVEGYYDNPLSVNPAIGHHMSAFIVKCLQPDPTLRYQSASEAITALETVFEQLEMSNFNELQKGYLLSPETWEKEHAELVISKTVQFGIEAKKSRKLPQAMNHLNRVLEMDPTNDDALKLVNMLSMRRHFRRSAERIGMASSAIIILATIVFLVIQYNMGDSTDDSNKQKGHLKLPKTIDTAIIEIDTDSKLGIKPSSSKKIIIVDHGKYDTDKEIEPTKRIVRKAATVKKKPVVIEQQKVVFNPHPMGVDIMIDGGKPFTFKTTSRSRILDTGSHQITFIPKDVRLKTLVKVIEVKKSDKPQNVGVRLQWKPGILLVKSNVDTGVAINGLSRGKTNRPISIPVKNGPTQNIKILVSARGYIPFEQTVPIQAGKNSEITVQLNNM